MEILVALAAVLSVSVAPPTPPGPSCALYDDSPVGVVCFHGDDLTSAIAMGQTGWLVEFYSSWCGHCQNFAPTWKELARGVAGWSLVVKLGVIDCSAKDSYETCSKYSIYGYPTVRFFSPGQKLKNATSDNYHGSRVVEDMENAIISHVESWEGTSEAKWPHFQPLEGDHILAIPPEEWTPAALVFEEKDSPLGRKLMLDLLDLRQLPVYRTLPSNLNLVHHYSILEFPSLVIETKKDDYIVVPGHSLSDPRRDFAEAVRKHFRNIPQTLTSPPPTFHPPSLTSQNQDNSLSLDLQDTVRKTASSITSFKSNRVSEVDVLGAVSYIFRREVPLHSTVAGPTFTALLRFTHLLEDVFSQAYPAAVPGLSQLRAKLETRLSAGFITSRDWTRLIDTRLNESIFPVDPVWANCKGSKSHFRGYPCALWTLSHTLTILTLPVYTPHNKPHPSISPGTSFRSKEALKIISSFIQNFFSCDHCREHFSEMARSLEGGGRVMYDGDAVLWLWEAHNRVNRRLVRDISSDPLHPKALFPSLKRCPYCYTYLSASLSETRQEGGGETTPTKPNWSNTGFRSKSESLVRVSSDSELRHRDLTFAWNRTAILLYLWGFYHWSHTSRHLTHRAILEAAWPNMAAKPLLRRYYSQPQTDPGLGLTSYDVGLCVTYYALCGGIMVGGAYWLLRRRLRHYRRFLHP